MNKIKRIGTYLFLMFSVSGAISCKKNSVVKEVVTETPVEVPAKDRNYLKVANTIIIAPGLESARFEWQNESKKAVTIKFSYAVEGINKQTIVENNTDAIGSLTIPIFGITNFSITISNTGETIAVTKLMGILPTLKPEIKLSKSGWTATASSEINHPDEELNGAENIVDPVDKKSVTAPALPSFWQSNYNLDPIYPYPHWLIVDLKTAIKITKIGLNAHTDGNQGFSQFKLEGSTDGVTFTDIADGQKTFNPATTKEQTFEVNTGTIRYVKIILLVGSPYPCLANFEAYARQ
jgi:hypothetical protein